MNTTELNLSPTCPRLAIFSLRELHQTSPSASRAETSSRYQSDPHENQIWHTDEEGASLACYQSTLISGTSFFSQWYFSSSGRSTNEILWEIVASSPFPCPSRLRRSLERSRETRFLLAQIGELASRLYVLSVMQAPVFFVTIEACIKSDITHKAQVLSHPRSQGRTTSRSLDNLLKGGTYLHTSKWHFPFPTRNFYFCLTNVYQSLSLLNFWRVARARFDPGPTDVQSPT